MDRSVVRDIEQEVSTDGSFTGRVRGHFFTTEVPYEWFCIQPSMEAMAGEDWASKKHEEGCRSRTARMDAEGGKRLEKTGRWLRHPGLILFLT